ncbi:MAG: DUF2130 domain-containing protein [Candidatus Bathyarchaeia archaeon]
MTMISPTLAMPPTEMWSQLKSENRGFALKQIKRGAWDFAVDLARFSLGNIENTSSNDLMIQQALQQFSTTAIGIKDQLLGAFSENTYQYRQTILEDLNRHLSLVHKRLEDITRENANLNPAVKESLASVNASTSALTALMASLRLPGVKGEVAEIAVLDSIRSAFLAIPNVTIEQLGNSGAPDGIIHLDVGGVELAKVLIECKNRSTWSNSFLVQLERDMKERRAQFGILVTTVLPKEGKSRGYAVTENAGIIIITAPELAPAITLVLYELVRSLDRLSTKAQTLQVLLRSRELAECVTSNLSLIQSLQTIIKTMDKAHSDVTTTVTNIMEAIERNNAKLAESLPRKEMTLT